jgi:two-component system, NtrC family, sensor kinase
MLTLVVAEGPDRGAAFPLPPGEPQLIGRSSEALPLTDRRISRRHAELTRRAVPMTPGGSFAISTR